jgi:hypothetical protein
LNLDLDDNDKDDTPVVEYMSPESLEDKLNLSLPQDGVDAARKSTPLAPYGTLLALPKRRLFHS